MDKEVGSSLFVNDGSFMEKFMKLQQQKQEKERVTVEHNGSLPGNSSGAQKPNTVTANVALDFKINPMNKSNSSKSSGKLAFSLKQKSKLAVAPVKLGAEEDEDDGNALESPHDGLVKRQKLGQPNGSEPSPKPEGVAPSSPSDPTVKKVAEKLASFVAKNGRQFEHITRQRNPGDTPFKFLYDVNCADYKYYEYCLTEEEKILEERKDCHGSRGAATNHSSSKRLNGSERSPVQPHSSYQTPASALYEANEEQRLSTSVEAASAGSASSSEANGPSAADPIAMMEFYVQKAAQEERRRRPKQSKDEMPPPASLQATAKRGHHMGDYIPPEELEKFLSNCNDAAAQKAAKEAAERSKIQADNVGHRLLSKMGWKEGEGLGSSRIGRADPVMAGNVKIDHLGVGAENPGEVTPEDDIYEQYKKRMMLGYRYRPNPLNNPRKAYY